MCNWVVLQPLDGIISVVAVVYTIGQLCSYLPIKFTERHKDCFHTHFWLAIGNKFAHYIKWKPLYLTEFIALDSSHYVIRTTSIVQNWSHRITSPSSTYGNPSEAHYKPHRQEPNRNNSIQGLCQVAIAPGVLHLLPSSTQVPNRTSSSKTSCKAFATYI